MTFSRIAGSVSFLGLILISAAELSWSSPIKQPSAAIPDPIKNK